MGEKLNFPKLEFLTAIPSKIHDRSELLFKDTQEWCAKQSKIMSVENKFKVMKIHLFSARNYYYGDYSRVLAINKLAEILFVIDDAFEENRSTRVYDLCNRLMKITENKEQLDPSSKHWLEACYSNALNDIYRSALLEEASKEWVERFIGSLILYFSNISYEFEYREKGTVPTLAEYMTLRLVGLGVDFFFDYIEFASNKYLPPKVIANHVFQSLVYYCRLVLLGANDLYSYTKEVSAGDVFNLIIVYKNQYNISTQEAIDKTVEFTENAWNIYVETKKKCEHIVPIDVHFYIDGLDAIIKGSYDFLHESNRYDFLK